MKSVTEMAKTHSLPTPRSADMESLSEQTTYNINGIFKLFKAIFPTFKQNFPDDESLRIAKKVWVKALLENHITSYEQIKVGMCKARASGDFMPSPGKFIAWCNPTAEDFGLPSKEDAYREAIDNLGEFNTATWSHPAVLEAVKNTTCYALKNLPEKDSRAMFYRNYAIMVERVMRGENLQVDIPKAIPEFTEFRPALPEVGQSYLADIKKKLGLV